MLNNGLFTRNSKWRLNRERVYYKLLAGYPRYARSDSPVTLGGSRATRGASLVVTGAGVFEVLW